MTGTRRILFAAGCGVGLLFGATTGRAQVMDYGGLEAMFGEPVTTSATGSPQKAADAPVNMEIITADDIRRSGADNIPDILRTVAGVDVRKYGASDSDVAIRGYNAANSPRVLVLLNGRQIYIDFFGYTAWQTLPVQLEEIRQIEVIKGPNSALYGFNAVGGVINIVTYDPLFDTVDEATARGGSRGDQQASGAGTIHLGDHAGLRLSAGEHGMDEVSTSQMPTANSPNGLGPFPGHNFSRSVSAQARAQMPSGLDLAMEADGGEARQFEMTIGGWPAWTAYAYDREKIGLGGESAVGYLSLNAYRNYVRYDYLAGYNCAVCTGIDNSLYVVQVNDLMKFSEHTLRAGLEYRSNSAGGSIFRGEQLGFDLYAADAMWNWQITPDLALTNSGRVDHMVTNFKGFVDPSLAFSAQDYDGRTFTEPSFNSALVYKPTAVDSIRVSAARGVQIPSYYQLFPQPVDGFQNPSLQGNPYVKPSVVMNYEVDYGRAVAEIRSKAQLALFHQISSNVLALPGDGGSGALTQGANNQNYAYAANIGRSVADGGELGVKGADDDGWRWRASYAYIVITDHYVVNPDLGSPDSSVDNQRGAPQHVVNLGLGRTWGRIEADVNARWQSGYDDLVVLSSSATTLVKPTSRIHVADYATLGARVGYNVTDHLTVALSGDQLNRANQTETGGPETERRVLGTVTVHY
jgi:iron complex outermembrane receptor protein